MTDTSLSTMKQPTAFQQYLDCFAELTPTSLHSKLAPLLHDQIEFKDPFNHARNKADTLAIFEHMFATVHHPKFEILHACQEGRTGYVHWRFSFYASHKAKEASVLQGLSQIEMDDNGTICKHIDYWDPAEQIYQHLPLIGSVLKLIRRKLSATDHG